MGRDFAGLQGAGMGLESFPRHAGRGGDEARQNHPGRGRRPHPSAPPCPIAIPKLFLQPHMLIIFRSSGTISYF